MLKRILFVLFLFILIPTVVLAWGDCPMGKVLCDEKCELFIDIDNDGICDYSQPAPEDRIRTVEENTDNLISGSELKTKTVNEVAEIYQISANEYAEKLSEYYGVKINPNYSFQLLHDNYGMEPSIVKSIAASIKLGTLIDVSEANNKENKGVYHFLPISLLLILLYSISHILSKKKIISIVNHRKIWNILLLITFLISGILGILLILRINFGWIIPLPFNILFWHVEVGIAMFAISIFHISWHWTYFKNILRTKKH